MDQPAPYASRLLHRYAVLVAVATWLLLLAGALVTSTDSGLAVPDWPLSYGTLFPPMVGGIRFEHGHRMLAGAVGLLILGLAVWLWAAEARRALRRLGAAALGLVVLQAVLGGLTVLWLLPPQISIAHACLGQTVFCVVTALAAATSPRWEEAPVPLRDAARPPLRELATVVAGLAAGQLLLGAVIRHTTTTIVPHMVGACLLVVGVLWLGVRSFRRRRETPWLWHAAGRLAGLLGLQVILGSAVLMHRGAVTPRTAHLALGALVLAQAVLLAWQVRRRTTPALRRTATSVRGGAGAYWELTKPRLTLLVLATMAAGYWLGAGASADWRLLTAGLIGTGLVAGGANALNQWWERDADALMRRTRQRPLPSGRLAPEAARRFGWALIAGGLLVLAAGTNWWAVGLAGLSAASYVYAYTPLKSRTALCTLVGAIPGALPPMIGWAVARDGLGVGAWALFAVLFMWQLPHFLALALLYQEDYARAGFKMLPVIDVDGLATARQIALYALALLPVSVFPATVGLGGRAYVAGALGLGLAFLAVSLSAAWRRTLPSCRRLFLASLLYLPLLLGLLVLNRSGI